MNNRGSTSGVLTIAILLGVLAFAALGTLVVSHHDVARESAERAAGLPETYSGPTGRIAALTDSDPNFFVVEYLNDTPTTFRQVWYRCDAFDAHGGMLGEKVYFFPDDTAVIDVYPRYYGRKRLVIPAPNRAAFSRMECAVERVVVAP